jgi:hypothetical protein
MNDKEKKGFCNSIKALIDYGKLCKSIRQYELNRTVFAELLNSLISYRFNPSVLIIDKPIISSVGEDMRKLLVEDSRAWENVCNNYISTGVFCFGCKVYIAISSNFIKNNAALFSTFPEMGLATFCPVSVTTRDIALEIAIEDFLTVHKCRNSIGKVFTKNNDGRSTCVWCGSPTKKVDSGFKFYSVCTRCGK